MCRRKTFLVLFAGFGLSCTKYDGLPELAPASGSGTGSLTYLTQSSSTIESSSSSSNNESQMDSTSSEQANSIPKAEESGEFDPSEDGPDGCFEDDAHDGDFSAMHVGHLKRDGVIEVKSSIQSKSSLCDHIDAYRFHVSERVTRAKFRFSGLGKGRVKYSIRRPHRKSSISGIIPLNHDVQERVIVFPPGDFIVSFSILEHEDDREDWASLEMRVSEVQESEARQTSISCLRLHECEKLGPFASDTDFDQPEMHGYVGPFHNNDFYIVSPGGDKYVDLGLRSLFGTPEVTFGLVNVSNNGDREFEPIRKIVTDEGQFLKARLDFRKTHSLYAIRVSPGPYGSDYIIHYGHDLDG